LNGPKTVENGRDAHGRFLPGNPGGGRPANPFGRYQAELRGALLAEVAPADLRAILRQVIRIAKRGHLPAVELLLKWTLGAPPAPVDPDRVDEHELSVRRGRPSLLDVMTLADEQAAEDPDEAHAVEDVDEIPELPDPPLRALLSWTVRELAEAQRRVAPPPAPDPVAGWEAFAASHLEWEAAAAVPVDLLYLAYACWCATRREPALVEDQVLAWLTAHGATVHTGALSQVTSVQGVRVVG
jgi:hypothetical protein